MMKVRKVGILMLNENIKNLRRSKGLSQEEFAAKLNVVRQTVSKWENGLSVPDSEMLVRIAAEMDTSVNALLGETVLTDDSSELKAIAAKLELVNDQIAANKCRQRKILRAVFIAAAVLSGLYLIRGLINLVWFHTADKINIGGGLAIIGGADGPTSIVLANPTFNVFAFLFALAVFIAAVIGVCKTHK